MKICSQCGYCNSDYMETCVRCHMSLNNPQGASSGPTVPSAFGQAMPRPGQGLPQGANRPPFPAPRQPYAPQGSAGMIPPRSPYSQPPTTQILRSMPGRQPFPQQPAWPPSVAYPNQHGPSAYPDFADPQPPSFPENENPDSFGDFSDAPAKRSSAGIVILVLLFLCVSIGGVTWWFYSNELFSIETRMTIDSVIDSVTGLFTDSNASGDTDNEAYDTMLSRMRNSVGTNDEQSKAIVDTLLYTCGASSIDGIIALAGTPLFQINSPEGSFHIRVDPDSKAMLSVETIETIPRAIFSDGTLHASIADYCVPAEEKAKLQEHAQEALKSALSNPELVTFSDKDWEFHKDKDWVSVSCFAISETEGTVQNQIPFYFEYQKQEGTFKLLYAQISDKVSGTPHFDGANTDNPYENEGDYGTPSSSEASSDQPAA